MSERAPKIAVRGLKAWHDDRQVLRGVDVDIADRGVTAFIGPTESGKSTLLRCINRMHELAPGARTEGTIEIDGEDISAGDPVLLRRRVGMVFPVPSPFPSMSIRENVLAGLRLTGGAPEGARAEATVERSLRRAGLWNEVRARLDVYSTELSIGQQQRLCVARAIAVEPEILLMDEPCARLDPVATAKIEDLLTELREHYTVVIATHSMQQAARVSRQVGFFLDGELVEFGDTDILFTAPSDERTEAYITSTFG